MLRLLPFVFSLCASAAMAQDCVPIADACLTPEDSRVAFGPDTLDDLPKLSDVPWVQSVELAGDGDPARTVDLSPLNGLAALTYLRVDQLPGARWDTLDLPGLLAIRLKDNGISDFGFLSGMPKLVALWLKEDVGLSDIPRQTLARVENLRLNGPDLRDINADGALVNLKILGFWNVTLPDLKGLGPTPALEVLNVEGQQIDSLDGLIVGPAFRKLMAKESTLTDISALAPAENIEAVLAKNSRIADISALSGKTQLKTLFLTGTQVAVLSPIKDMTALQMLSFSDTPVTDISALAGLPELVVIYMNVTRVTDFTPLLQSRPDIILRINSDQILASGRLPEFIANEGWKRGPLYEN
ncbi:hypothetical protein [Antarctobacter sp.]|uniref:leucine-rich repeat domain-containing protein n=1 Tax=Antarctobacter sp. TaxID=1872577 RepID=UPI002B26F4A8|nr:hypothetical protein [Antarctobacter sp.]